MLFRSGYYYSATIINRNKAFTDLKDDDWQIVEVKEPLGFFQLMGKQGVIQQGTLEDGSEEELIKHVRQYKDDYSEATISKYENCTFKKINLLTI